jgi:hypothetical protein
VAPNGVIFAHFRPKSGPQKVQNLDTFAPAQKKLPELRL